MTTLLLLLSVVSLDVSSSRTLDLHASIERTSLRLAAGLVASLGREESLRLAARMLEGPSPDAHVHNPRLYVDGVRDGGPSSRVCRSLWRLAAFSLDRSQPGQSVELRYTLTYHGLTIHRRTRVVEGLVVSHASWQGQAGPQKRLKAAWVTIRARESPQGTRISTDATARVNAGICAARSASRLEAVNRLAGRRVAAEMDEALEAAEQQVRGVAATGQDAIARLTSCALIHVIHTRGASDAGRGTQHATRSAGGQGGRTGAAD